MRKKHFVWCFYHLKLKERYIQKHKKAAECALELTKKNIYKVLFFRVLISGWTVIYSQRSTTNNT